MPVPLQCQLQSPSVAIAGIYRSLGWLYYQKRKKKETNKKKTATNKKNHPSPSVCALHCPGFPLTATDAETLAPRSRAAA